MVWVEGATPPGKADSLPIVMPARPGVHAEPIGMGSLSALSPGAGAAPGESELRYQLRPHRDHPDKKGNGRQRGRFFHENLQHDSLLTGEHRENNVLFLFLGVKLG